VIQKMIHLLDEIWIAGEFQTNQKFLIELLSSPFVREDMIYAGYCEEEFIPELRPPLPVLKKMAETVDFLLKQKYPDAYAKIRSTASDSRLKKYLVSQIWFDILSNDEEVSTNHAYFISKTNRLTGLLCQVVLNIGSTSKIYRCCIFPLASDRMIVRIGPWVQLVRTQVNSQMSSGMSSMMNALVRGKVHEIHFLKDAIVPAHESILVLESLGVLVSHSLPRQAKLLEWKCQLEEVVSLGQELAQIQLIR
jgi:acetyl/propionyl-CoA carboxylase alpha subunit